MTIVQVLEGVLTQGIPIALIFWLLERPWVERWYVKMAPYFAKEWGCSVKVLKRATAMLLSFALSVLAYLLYGTLGYVVFPASLEGWLNQILYLGTLVYTSTQVLHMTTYQRKSTYITQY